MVFPVAPKFCLHWDGGQTPPTPTNRVLGSLEPWFKVFLGGLRGCKGFKQA